ncbi:uncharacterized protein PFL1_04935 [Pseudozyma flocculosa PF-1]|uniref:GH16 domain-containing protein n=2 Tax=Pseudozyma flocculosa TaxID=84751 RepID=A0A5C3EWN9_9BASI|nr:uncharacterized protein PFL1_04935 [Pseudozyma flocculosa PF-1]EPQ27397.1 hypothetical protein PFL1_04935 [Pseudozyma flocculosa PF-1]SPO36185.1 uncharacterized protein PSFLO_01656 [Pseudozyma flocculosa]
MVFSTLLTSLLAASTAVQAGVIWPSNANTTSMHTLERRAYSRQVYAATPTDFYNVFDFHTEPDPSGGTVQYVDQGTASSLGMIGTGRNGGFRFGVDSHTANANPRKSVRLQSKAGYGYGVYVFDVAHAPVGCGTWPALWTYTRGTWPDGGEIDIYEGVNGVAPNQATLHTGPGCIKAPSALQTGTNVSPTDCNVKDGANGNAGCAVFMPSSNSFGAGLNANGGGVFAMQYVAEGVFVWFWPSSSAPAGTKRGDSRTIDVASWGTPTAAFPFYDGCTASHIDTNQQVTMNIDFCGGFVNSRPGSSCGMVANNAQCIAYVQNNPSAFTEAYFDVNAFAFWA